MTAPAQAGPAPVAGDPAAVRRTAWSMTVYGDLLHDAGAGLARIDTTDGWSGPAADAFRQVYRGQHAAWTRAGDCFHDAATALARYADTLAWAQSRLAAAGRDWAAAAAQTGAALDAYRRAAAVSPAGSVGAFRDPGAEGRAAAADLADRAHAQLAAAAAAAAEVVERARDQAPPEPTLLDQAAAIATAGSELLVDGLGALGRAVAGNPAAVVGMVVGGGLMAVSAVGELAGVAADATVVGAPPGLALNALSTAGLATGATMAGLGAAALGNDISRELTVATAAGDDNPVPPRELGPAWEGVASARPNGADVHTDPLDRIHTLDGDPNTLKNGGHAPGTGRPDKTEFPDTELWTDDHIIEAIEDVARDPDRQPVLDAGSGNYKFHGFRDGVEIEGYITPEGRVLTGYPIGGEGVTINDADGNPHPLAN